MISIAFDNLCLLLSAQFFIQKNQHNQKVDAFGDRRSLIGIEIKEKYWLNYYLFYGHLMKLTIITLKTGECTISGHL
jgi:hypothetical protein